MRCTQVRSAARCKHVTLQPQCLSPVLPAHHWRCGRVNSSSSRRAKTPQASADPAPVTAQPSSVIAARYGDLAWASCVSSKPSVKAAVQEAVDGILEHQEDDFEPHLAIVFASCNYGSQLQDVVGAIRRQVPTVRHVFGCSAFGVLGSSPGGAVEVEGEPGISLTLAALPGVEVSVMHTLRSSIPSEDASPEAWCDLVGLTPLEQLQQSTSTSAMATAEEEEIEEEQTTSSSNGEQRQVQEPEALPSRDATTTTSSSSNSQQRVTDAGGFSSRSSKQQPTSAVSFLVLCDPRFQQSKQLLAGLDFAFPTANKVGALLSQGQQNKRRLMFVWSADGSVQTGTTAWRRKQQQRRLLQQQQLASGSSHCNDASHHHTEQQQQQQHQQHQHQQQLAEVVQSQPSDSRQESRPEGKNDKKKGLFGTLFNSLLSSLNEDGVQQQQQQQPSNTNSSTKPAEYEVLNGGSSSSSSSTLGSPVKSVPSDDGDSTSSDNNDDDNNDDDNNDDDDSAATGDHPGVFMYGAAVLGLKGPVLLEPMICQGYRTVSSKVWTVGETSSNGDMILSLIDPDVSDSDQEEGEEAEVMPLVALHELLTAAEVDPAAPEDLIEELSSRLAVAIAADSWQPTSELQPDDFQVCTISAMWRRTGYFKVDGQARPGYRLKMVLRDESGIRDDLNNKVLGLKRAELAGVLSGNRKPPALGALMFSDIERGFVLYETPSYESGVVSRYLPAPLSGMFGSAQVSTFNKKAGLYELATAIGVVRPLPQTNPELTQQETV